MKNYLSNMKRNIILAPYTSFHIGGPAKYFLRARSENEIEEAFSWAKKKGIEVFILGGGTNLLISDKGVKGLVIKMDNTFLQFEKDRAVSGAGISLQKLIDQSIRRGLSGLETLSGIGGTLGGAVRGNAGAFGQNIGERVISVKAIINGDIKKFSRNKCIFQYRGSIFKKTKAIILSVHLQFIAGDPKKLRQKADEIIQTRNSRYNVNWQCAGCVFKNVDLRETKVDRKKIIKALDTEEKEYDTVTKYGKLPVSFITDKLGLKGKKIGGAKIAEEHGAFILNNGGAKAEDVIMLMSLIKQKVRDELAIELEPEIELVGF